jgi:hypothetical protein
VVFSERLIYHDIVNHIDEIVNHIHKTDVIQKILSKLIMWSCLQLSNCEFADLAVLLDSFKSDKKKVNAIPQAGTNVLILSKAARNGKHQVMFSPDSFKILSDIYSKFLDFHFSPVAPPKKIGTMDGFVFLFGNKYFYCYLKALSKKFI